MPDRIVYSDFRVIDELTAGQLSVYNQYSFPLTDGSANQVLATDGSGTIRFIDITDIALTSSNILNGTGITWTTVGNDVRGDVTLDPFDTDDLDEGSTNLYFTNERVDDRVATVIQDGTGISWSYSDVDNTLTPTVTLDPFNTDDLDEGSTNLYFTNERVDDRVAAILLPAIVNGSASPTNPIVWQYNDGPGTILPLVSLDPFDTDDLSEGSTNLYYTDERARDAAASLFANATHEGISFTYNDAANEITACVTPSPLEVMLEGTVCGCQPTIDFCMGSDIGITVSEDTLNNKVVVTVEYNGGCSVIQEGDGLNSSCRIDSCNDANGDYSGVLGGSNNCSNSNYSTIVGGDNNSVSSIYSTVVGGYNNCITSSLAPASTIVGGCNNKICDRNCGSSIGGGMFNTIFCTSAIDRAVTIAGGCCNSAAGLGSVISGGRSNIAYCRSVVVGGDSNTASGSWSTILGGICNSTGCNILGCDSPYGAGSIAGGVGANYAGATIYLGSDDIVFNGTMSRCNNGQFSTAVGGFQNRSEGLLSAVVGGHENIVSGVSSSILGGCNNIITGDTSSILGGQDNANSGDFSAILGGRDNALTHNCSFIAGCNIASVGANIFHVNCLYLGDVPTSDPGIQGVVYSSGGTLMISV